MLPLLLVAQLNIPPQNLPTLSVTPAPHPFDSRLQKQQLRQLEEKLNTAQKQYELEKKQLEALPPSRLDCYPRFPPITGFDPISCSIP